MKMLRTISLCFVLSFVFLQAATVEGADSNRTNWAGNVVYSADHLQEAASVQRIRTLVKSETKVTALGTRHCFNTIADNAHTQLSVLQMHDVVSLDATARTVTVAAGITYAQLSPYLHTHGFALHNLASLPDISIAGAISTATHGSGVRNGNLATAVSALELVTADGEVVKFSRGHGLNGVVVGLGAVGIITRITLDLQPTFTVKQFVYENLPLAQFEDHFDEIMASGYSVSLFTDWQKKRFTTVWIKSREGYGLPFAAPEEYFGATLATQNLHPIPGLSAENCTQQMGVPGPWHERLPHFRAGVTASVGKELQSEFFIPRRHAVAAILALESNLRNEIGPHLFISEIRTIAGDANWMSTAYRRESVAIHFTWKQEWPAVQLLLPLIERELAPFRPRPHWGKLFTMSPSELQSRYKMVDEFRSLAAKHDPTGKFRNKFLNTNIFTSDV
ncbi:hypothetical protein KC19_8G151900 [Ceratodon purpureus]|uniref:FAD-binding PCMH-type domain-containing protein n=1 Tax=Ceratodon purpureus TaxID=3225 RepID=A0A8T0H2E6_CERPU|nr:hypothetical protein KC19_8G151900 [Ceratodon purpureus]KAG0564947.1 hypothetical protein KC19_8G151900 [Ceratodon purpureus]KAG0564948.1 hypothetical protein KC19_8G151900 [Ceratodon purpureus]